MSLVEVLDLLSLELMTLLVVSYSNHFSFSFFSSMYSADIFLERFLFLLFLVDIFSPEDVFNFYSFSYLY